MTLNRNPLLANPIFRTRDPFGLGQGSRRVVSADQNARGLWERDRTPSVSYVCLFDVSETGENPVVETGCVNLSVLMPVLAVMMVSILLNVHFVVQWRRRQQWLLSEEDFLQLQMAQEGTVVNHEKPEEEIVVKNKNKKCFGGLRKRRKENEEIGQLSDEKDDQEREKNKELIEMQEKVHIPRTQDNAQDGPPTQDTPLSLDSPREKGIPRLQEILRMPEISPIVVQESPRAQESARVPDSPRTLESPRAQDIPRLEDILHVQEVSPDSPRSLDSPRAQDIPRLEDFLRATDDEEHGGAAPVSMDADRRSAVIESPRIADFFFAGDDSDGDHQSVQSEEPLVSHYMEKMDFETGHEEEEPGDEPLVSHYMEKMDFEGANDDEEPVLK